MIEPETETTLIRQALTVHWSDDGIQVHQYDDEPGVLKYLNPSGHLVKITVEVLP